MLSRLGNSFRMALLSLAANKVRAALTMLGIIIGVAAVVTMTAIGQGAQKAVADQIASMGTNLLTIFPGAVSGGGVSLGAGTSNRLTEDDANAIAKNATLIAYVAPIVQTSVQVVAANMNWATRIYGTNPDYLTIKNWPLASGAIFSAGDMRTGNKVCILGKTVADNLFPDGSDPVGQTIRIKNLPFVVEGVLTSKGTNSFGQDQDDLIVAPLATVQKKLMGITWVNNINASTFDAATTNAAIQEITEIIRTQHKLQATDDNDFQVRSQLELANTAQQSSQAMTNLLQNAAIISLLVGGIGIMNIMLVTVTERTREIGIRKSIGAKSTDILVQFLTEALMLSLLGGMIGLLIGYGASAIISKSNGWVLVISPTATSLAFGASAAVGMFFGYYPARKASRLNPIEALRYE